MPLRAAASTTRPVRRTPLLATLLAAASLLGLIAAAPAAAQEPAPPTPIQTDWTSVRSGVAYGSVGGRSVTLSGTNVDAAPASILGGTSAYFNNAAFTPALTRADALQVRVVAGANYTLNFRAPVTNPILDIGSLASTFTFPAGLTITKVSGDITVTGAKATGMSVVGALGGTAPLTDRNGTVSITGTFTSLTFTAAPVYSGGNPDGVLIEPGAGWRIADTPLIARWPLDTVADGAVAQDFGTNFRNGTGVTNDVSIKPGRFGGAYDLPGNANNGFTIPGSGNGMASQPDALEPTGSFTLMTWVKSDGVAGTAGAPGPNRRVVVHGGVDCRDPAYGFTTDANGGLTYNVEFKGNTYGIWDALYVGHVPAAQIWDGNWHAIAGVYDKANGGTSRTVSLYVDGVRAATAGLPSSDLEDIDWFSLHVVDQQMTAGFSPTNVNYSFCDHDTRAFHGQLDEIRLYGAALTGHQIAQLQNANAIDPPNLSDDFSPKNTVRPGLSGTPKVGSAIACDNGTWTGNAGHVVYTTVWERAPQSVTTEGDPAWAPIDGAVGSTYLVQPIDDGSRLRCRVTRSDDGGTDDVVSSRSLRAAADVPGSVVAPTVTGFPSSGAVPADGSVSILNVKLTCETGTWSNSPDFTYQWRRDGVPITGATFKAYQPKRVRQPGTGTFIGGGDGNHKISCEVTATNDVGTTKAASNDVLAIDDIPYASDRPYITFGEQKKASYVGTTASCTNGSWLDDYSQFGKAPYLYRYQWFREGAPIDGATTNAYTVGVADLGRNITCQVIASNPLGDGKPALSDARLVPLPPAYASPKLNISLAGSKNDADPTNLIAISQAYQDQISGVVAARLQAAIDKLKPSCASVPNVVKTPFAAPLAINSLTPMTEALRCQLLIYDSQRVIVTYWGVQYFNGACDLTGYASFFNPFGRCASLGIQVPAIDPKNPPAADQELLEKLKPYSPQTVLWDLDGDGRTDAACPGSAPVLRTIYPRANWHVRAIIVNESSADTDVFPEGTYDFKAPAQSTTSVSGTKKLRDGQVKVCATAFAPPPDPQTAPCVTTGVIGRVQVTGNLCPISERDIKDADYANLDGATKQLLQARSDEKLKGEGIAARAARAAAKAKGQAVTPIWVPLDGPSGPGIPAKRNFNFTLPDSLRTTAAAFGNTAAATTSIALAPSKLRSFGTSAISQIQKLVKPNLPFATDQIYASDAAGMIMNGIDIDPIGDSIDLLIPSDVKQALSDVKGMTVSARDAARTLGNQATGLPLALKGQLKAQLDDVESQGKDIANDAIGQGKALFEQTNLDDLAQSLKDKADKLNLGPFKLAGDAKVTLNNDGTATLKAYAELPNLKIGPGDARVRADIVLKADKTGKLTLDGIHLTAGLAYLGPIKLKDLDINWNNGLDIKGKIMFPAPLNEGIGINNFRLDSNGNFRALDVDYLAGPGGGIEAGPGTFITKLGGGLDLDANTVKGRATVSIGPSSGDGCPTAGIDADFAVHFAQLFSLDANGTVKLACIDVANVAFHADATGYVSLNANAHMDVGPVHLQAALGGAINLPEWQVTADGEGSINHIPIIGDIDAQIHAVLSNKGLAACGSIKVLFARLAGGAAIGFPHGIPPISFPALVANLHFFTGCDLSDYKTAVRPPGAARLANGSTSFVVPPGGAPQLFSFEGAGATPRVILHSPDGKTYDVSTADGPQGLSLGDVAASVIPEEDRTVVILGKPVAGTWTADLAPGSTPILRTRTADFLPSPKVKVKVKGRGAQRELTYSIAKLKGQSVKLVEADQGYTKTLKTITTGGSGTVKFAVGEAASKARTIQAQVVQNDLPRTSLTVAKFSAPNPRVGKVQKPKAVRSGSKIKVSWAAAPFAKTYEVAVIVDGGTAQLLEVPAGSKKISIPSIPKTSKVTIKVIAFSPAGTRGKPATVKVAAPRTTRGRTRRH